MTVPELCAADVRGIVGILPTPAKPGAERWDATDTVDLAESARLADACVRAGVDMLLTNGTFGECATLTWEELRAFVDTVVQTVRSRVPVCAGATTLNTRDTIRRARALIELGANGLFLGRPMWVALDDHGIVAYYRDVTEALPSAPIVVYDNPSAFKGKISPRAYSELAKLPQIIAAKHLGLATGLEALRRDLAAVRGQIRILPLDEEWYYAAKLFPEELPACWSGFYACGPAPLEALKAAILAHDWERAAVIQRDLEWATETFFPDGDLQKFLQYSIKLDKVRYETAGWFRPGPARPPYDYAPVAYQEGAAECGRRWRQLQEKYATLTESAGVAASTAG